MRQLALLLACLSLAACGEPSETAIDAAPVTDAPPPELLGACPLADKVGYFAIEDKPSSSSIAGKVEDVVHPMENLELVETAGNCRLYQRPSLFCEELCQSGTTCGPDGTCIPSPHSLSAGTVTVTGLVESVTMEPNAAVYYEANIPAEPFVVGAPIRLVAEGDVTAGFTLEGYGVTPLVLPPQTWTISRTQDLTITWEAAQGEGTIRAKLCIDEHGLAPVTLHCDFEDTGSGTVPAAIMGSLIDHGTSAGAPSAYLYRETIDSASIAEGCVQLDVNSWKAPTSVERP